MCHHILYLSIGKHFSNGQVLPKLTHRINAKVFGNWGKIAIFLKGHKADVYSRILAEGGARDVALLTMPFKRTELFAGVEEVEAIQFSYILSEPSCLESDPSFRYFVRSNPSNIHICTYLYAIECLSKVRQK